MRFQDLGKTRAIHALGLRVPAIHAVATTLALFGGALLYAWTRVLPMWLTLALCAGAALAGSAWTERPAQGRLWTSPLRGRVDYDA